MPEKEMGSHCIRASVGEDENDNGGDPSPKTRSSKPGFWEGKDAVWPMPE
jgi:hypothetical protein